MVNKQDGSAPVDVFQRKIDAISLELGVCQ
jgi:hypothetical protein